MKQTFAGAPNNRLQGTGTLKVGRASKVLFRSAVLRKSGPVAEPGVRGQAIDQATFLGREPMSRSSNYQRIYEIIRNIPKGKVATYGQIARLSGMPGHARQVGYALHVLLEESDVPWHRVINSKGEISLHPHDVSNSMQKALLRKEGISFDTENRISISVYGWRPKRSPRLKAK